MPQKKNPDMAELIRGKSGRVYGNLMGLLTVMKAIPLAYNKDLQEDKEGAFDTVNTVLTSLHVFTGMLATLTVNEERMANATTNDFSNATELADYLANKGIPFREAHAIVGKLVLDGLKKNRPLQDIPLAEYKEISPLIDEDVYHDLDAKVAVERRHSLGGTGFDQIKAELKRANEQLAQYQSLNSDN